VRADGSEEWLPAKVEGVKVKAGDLLYFNTWGGGGWGDPYARDPELVAQMSAVAWSAPRARALRCGDRRRWQRRRGCYA
jgi:N-methylhydantoinase B/oxoprolinase/acetone carboxylase alpha subunit